MQFGDQLHSQDPPRWSVFALGVAIGYIFCLAQVAAQAAR